MSAGRKWAAMVAYLFLVAVIAAQDTVPVPPVIVIKAGRLLDGTTKPALEHAVVLVRGDRIEAVGPASSVPIPAGARVIDLSSDTVLPGLINGHDHPTVRAFTGPEVPRQGR